MFEANGMHPDDLRPLAPSTASTYRESPMPGRGSSELLLYSPSLPSMSPWPTSMGGIPGMADAGDRPSTTPGSTRQAAAAGRRGLPSTSPGPPAASSLPCTPWPGQMPPSGREEETNQSPSLWPLQHSPSPIDANAMAQSPSPFESERASSKQRQLPELSTEDLKDTNIALRVEIEAIKAELVRRRNYVRDAASF